MKGIPFLPQIVKAVFKNISAVKVLWQHRGTCDFIKIQTQQNQGLTSLGSKLLEYLYCK